jgi:hypothetical protein
MTTTPAEMISDDESSSKKKGETLGNYIAADARRHYIPSFARRRSTLSKVTSENLSNMMKKQVHSKKCVSYALKKPIISRRRRQRQRLGQLETGL